MGPEIMQGKYLGDGLGDVFGVVLGFDVKPAHTLVTQWNMTVGFFLVSTRNQGHRSQVMGEGYRIILIDVSVNAKMQKCKTWRKQSVNGRKEKCTVPFKTPKRSSQLKNILSNSKKYNKRT
mmetsp:Transcript_40230/g.104229  ORF Transcript_40230/g.104229 Transcript_40230/m.104229 type:complete len:121 (-) Transcript_40230:1563-1925(-)